MKIFWQGTDITEYVMIRKAAARDTCGGRCDGLDIEFENAQSWYRWGPSEDDEIRVEQDNWDSGILYLNTIAPGNGKYRVLATALPCKARDKHWDSFENKTIEEILRRCAARTGMDFRIYGIDGSYRIPYIQQENESCAAFLNRLATLEGAAMKCINGRYAFIGIDWAQERKPVGVITISADQSGTDYRRNGAKSKGLIITTPFATGKAIDESVSVTHATEEISEYPALNNVQAARWARNLLKDRNRKCESMTIRSTFNPTWTAMSRIDITGGTDADGQWLIEDVEHDLKERSSRATLRRCILTVS